MSKLLFDKATIQPDIRPSVRNRKHKKHLAIKLKMMEAVQ